MNLLVVIVCAFCSAYSAPAETSPGTPAGGSSGTVAAESPSYGTVTANGLSNNLASINQNVYQGVTGLANPLLKFAVDTAPNLAQLYAIFNGVNVPPFLATLGKNLYGQGAVAGGKLAGGAAVLGSSVLQSGMKVASHGLQAGNDVAEAVGKSGIYLAGRLGDFASSGVSVGADIAAAGLKSLGDGMTAGSLGANVVSQGISDAIDAIGKRLVTGIVSAEQTAAKLMDSRVKSLEDGALKFADKTQERVYQGLVAYVQILTHLQNLINLMASAVSGVASAAGPRAQLTLGTPSASAAVSASM